MLTNTVYSVVDSLLGISSYGKKSSRLSSLIKNPSVLNNKIINYQRLIKEGKKLEATNHPIV